MAPETLFISDLHLSAAKPAPVSRLLRFLNDRAGRAERLYILGDLFDAYIGDDDDSAPNRNVKHALNRLSRAGTAVFFQHGNRDFLVGSGFCRQTGATLLDDYAVIDLYGRPALVTHGDLLCTDDVQYQTARERVRSSEWKRQALAKPLWMRQLYARWYRFKSGWDKGGKTAEIMDANPEAVRSAMERFGIDLLIHGHTHRPAVHDLLVNGRSAKRIVLAEWTDSQGQVLCCRSDGTVETEWLD
ncbi:MAG: UDP-2,3-diacylglucosamine diphosphatase [Methylococcaceae bacterium]|nr:UDP-2,3-diacylglucosamine diphosphatase [Methylococcaceae bacterium]